ncbi:MAG: VWA domain-containing protein, partial [Planctomycetes bacterium]|nr:VWA domain-containing protein [Planctomycetota bacterium]
MNFPLRFLNIEFLLLLGLLPFIWLIARRSLAGLSKGRRVVALALRFTIVTLIILALAKIQWRSPSEKVSVYFLLDWSDSIPKSPQKFRQELLDYMRDSCKSETRESDDTVGVIYFASDSSCETPPAPGQPPIDRQAIVDPNGTDIAAAVRLALSTFPTGTKKRIILATDGNQNRGDVLSEVEAVRTQGARLDVYPIQYSYDREIIAEKLICPDSIREGVPFKLTAV